LAYASNWQAIELVPFQFEPTVQAQATEMKQLAETLRGNLDKVVQHGKRADAIVKNMLLIACPILGLATIEHSVSWQHVSLTDPAMADCEGGNHFHEMEQLKPDSSTSSLRGHGKARDQIIPMGLFIHLPGFG
jgi:hypothetical protein